MQFCETDYEIDKFLIQQNEIRALIKSGFETKPFQLRKFWNQHFQLDDTCARKVQVYHTSVSCQMCDFLSRLFYLSTDTPFDIECGIYTGTTMKIKEWGILATKAYYSPDLSTNAEKILLTAPLLGECGYSAPERYLVCDPVTSRALACSILEEELPIGSFVTAFRCSHRYYTLEKVPLTWRTFPHHTIKNKMVAREILIQMISVLKRLSQYHYVSNIIDSDSIICYEEEAVSLMVDGVHVESPLLLTLDWTAGCSFTYQGTRICQESLLKVIHQVHPRLNNLLKIEYQGKTLTIYQLDYLTKDFFLKHRAAGVPLYPASLELYSCLLTLMANPVVYKLVVEDYSHVWGSLWMDDGGAYLVKQVLESWHARGHFPSREDNIRAVLGHRLRCDALEFFWNFLV